jgi:hypothetical protein
MKREEKPKPTKQERIAKYVEVIPPAIAGAGGHPQTFKVACSLYNGWALCEEETLAWLKVYNKKCEPRWSDKELEHKAKDATKVQHDKPRGYLLDASIADERPEPDWSLPTKPCASGKIPTTLTTLNSNLRAYMSTPTPLISTCARVRSKRSVVNVVKHTESANLTANSDLATVLDGKKDLDGLLTQLRQLKNDGAIHDGAIHDMADAEFYAHLLTAFDPTYTGADGAEKGEHPVDRVPDPPSGLSPQERMEFYKADLEDAIGEEYIDRDYRPPARPAQSAPREKKRKATYYAE